MSVALYVVGAVAIVFGAVILRGAPYVPSHRRQLERAFTKLYPLGEKDTLVDLGAGDGAVLKVASNFGARAIGYEINPLLVLIISLRFLHRKNISVKLRDYLLVPELPAATTVVYVFATGRDIEKVNKKMIQWSRNKPLMLVSYGFKIKNKTPVKSLAPFELYRYEPQSLQQKAQ